MDEDIRTIIMDLPHSVHGFCYHDDNGESYIVINARLSVDMQRRTYLHELTHIRNGDMYNPEYREYAAGGC